MANKERIACDYEGCDKPFAYMLGPFRLCSKHLGEGDAKTWKDHLLEYFEKVKSEADNPKV